MRLEGRRGKRRDDKPTGLAGVMENEKKLDPVGSTVRYEMMKLCTGSV